MSNLKPPVWRSLLFIPANNQTFVEKAHTRNADAIILDLEDSVAPTQKADARAGLETAASVIVSNGTQVLVRINAESIQEDVAAAAVSAVSALIIPKVNTADSVRQVATLLDQLESQRGLPTEGIRLLAQIEDVRALQNLDQIAQASSRLIGMSLGSEDFSVSAGMLPVPETLYWPNQQVAFACRRAGVLPFGFPASITLFEDVLALESAAAQASDMGFVGAFCIHPKQVPILNAAFTPSDAALSTARSLLKEYQKVKSEDIGVFAHKGKMVDLPVVLRAQELVARAEAIASKPNGHHK